MSLYRGKQKKTLVKNWSTLMCLVSSPQSLQKRAQRLSSAAASAHSSWCGHTNKIPRFETLMENQHLKNSNHIIPIFMYSGTKLIAGFCYYFCRPQTETKQKPASSTRLSEGEAALSRLWISHLHILISAAQRETWKHCRLLLYPVIHCTQKVSERSGRFSDWK